MTIKLINTDGDVIFTATRVKDISDAVRAAIAENVDLSKIDLAGANLRNVKFSGRNLRYANFARADLSGAHFDNCDLAKALFVRANLEYVNFKGAELPTFHSFNGAALGEVVIDDPKINALLTKSTQIVPAKGAFIGFKKLRNGRICTLLIPAHAKRVGGMYGRKCRASEAIVISGSGTSGYDCDFKYAKGKTVKPTRAFDPSFSECESGIHFFMSREEAMAYIL